jgi:hypothetical protein
MPRALINGLWEWRIGVCGPHRRWINLPESGRLGGGGASQLLSRRWKSPGVGLSKPLSAQT